MVFLIKKDFFKEHILGITLNYTCKYNSGIQAFQWEDLEVVCVSACVCGACVCVCVQHN